MIYFKVWNRMRLAIDMNQRYAKMRAHTATHLLHAQLAKIFPNTKQAWSMVDSDLLRFDFYANNLLTGDQIREIEKNVNQIIFQAVPVDLIETTFDEAVKYGAKAFFEEKYWNNVRMIRVHDGDQNVSVELCGWTHVSNTREIWAFTIVSQEAVASWIKRITAYTWAKVIEKIHNYEGVLDNAVNVLDVKSYAQIGEKLAKISKENLELQQRIEALEVSSLRVNLQSSNAKSNWDFSKIIKLSGGTNFKFLNGLLKEVFPEEKSILVLTDEWNYLISTNGMVSAKELAKKYNLRWGGSDLIAQWKDENVRNIYWD